MKTIKQFFHHTAGHPQWIWHTTVRAIPVWPCHAVPMVSSAEEVFFGGFKRRVASFRVAGVALRDIQTCFVVYRKSFCVAGAILATFSQDELQFSWQAQHFGRVHRHFAWQAQHFRRVVLRVFCESHCASSGDKVQIPWQVWHFVRCDEN